MATEGRWENVFNCRERHVARAVWAGTQLRNSELTSLPERNVPRF